MKYEECIREIEGFGIMPQKTPSLNLMKGVLNEADFKIDPKKVILVAGTNGKGSASATLESLLLTAEKTVGLYTSPHLISTTERFRIQGKDISPELFEKLYLQNRPLILKHKLSHFEALTLLAADLFFSKRFHSPLDHIIFEVGLGGTWDATNAIPHNTCVITSLGFDHEKFLGNTLESIAKNKFGIVTEKSQVIHTRFSVELNPLAEEVRKRTNSRWISALDFQWNVEKIKFEEPQWQLILGSEKFNLNLPGPRGAENTATALTVFKELGFDIEDFSLVKEALKNVRWPGRMEKALSSKASCPVYFSGDHNPQGVQSLIELLEHYSYKQIHIMIGIGQDKNAEEMLGMFSKIRDSKLYLTKTPFKGRDVASYPKCEGLVFSHDNPEKVLGHILETAQKEDMILVTGSLYLVGEAKSYLNP